ncbi:hypothetical protein MST27_04470 [Pseudomonas sp. PS1]|uniref:Uncharacterized protein n=1 Tax=Stutzerimonas marianensis TaxID=2929513 RepID=A0A9X2ARK9_9GAMM|nr:hypothetical protein [Pseudomonas marianensis]MCJ0972620.1 hypothetical protein [Pseudomonas marianensis]
MAGTNANVALFPDVLRNARPADQLLARLDIRRYVFMPSLPTFTEVIMGTAALLVGLIVALFFSVYFMRKALRALPVERERPGIAPDAKLSSSVEKISPV